MSRHTVVTPTRKVRPWSMATDLASAKPMDSKEQVMTSNMTKGLLRTKSPSGEMKRIPVAYPA